MWIHYHVLKIHRSLDILSCRNLLDGAKLTVKLCNSVPCLIDPSIFNTIKWNEVSLFIFEISPNVIAAGSEFGPNFFAFFFKKFSCRRDIREFILTAPFSRPLRLHSSASFGNEGSHTSIRNLYPLCHDGLDSQLKGRCARLRYARPIELQSLYVLNACDSTKRWMSALIFLNPFFLFFGDKAMRTFANAER